MNIIIAAMAVVAIFAAGDARAFDGTTSTDRPSPSWGSSAGQRRLEPIFQRRLGLILMSVTARRFRTDCPTFVQIDQQRLDRVAKFVDELPDAAAIAKIETSIEATVIAMGPSRKEQYCDITLREIERLGGVQ